MPQMNSMPWLLLLIFFVSGYLLLYVKIYYM